MATVVVGLLCVLGVVVGSPVRTYDQRQQGELNIHAQLDNIVIVLIPTSNLNLLDLAGKTKFSGDKGGLLQFFQKPLKDIDRYETVKDGAEETSQNDIKTELVVPVVTSQQVALNHEDKKGMHEENEEEVVATVEEMKPETTEKTVDEVKSEATEDGPIKEESTISGAKQESVLSVTIPESLKDTVEAEEEESKDVHKSSEEESESIPQISPGPNLHLLPFDGNSGKESTKKEVLPEKEPSPPKIEETADKENLKDSSESTEPEGTAIRNLLIKPVAVKEVKQDKEETSPSKVEYIADKEKSKESSEPSSEEADIRSLLTKPVAVKEETSPSKVEETADKEKSKESSEPSPEGTALRNIFIKSVAAKEVKPESPDTPKKIPTTEEPSPAEPKKITEPARLESVRREKVIRYKPDTKWAPELVDLLGPPKPKPRELDERQRYAGICSPGVWDTELKTCIMPGETRSRNELARFLEAMRFGIAIPNQ